MLGGRGISIADRDDLPETWTWIIMPSVNHRRLTVAFGLGAVCPKDIKDDLQCYYTKHDGTKRHARGTLVTCSMEWRTTKNKRNTAIGEPTEYGVTVWGSHFKIFVDPSANTMWPSPRHQNLQIVCHSPTLFHRSFSWETLECHPTSNLFLRFLMDGGGRGVKEEFAAVQRSHHCLVLG